MNEIVFTSILAILSNANSYRDINIFCSKKKDFLKEKYEIEWNSPPAYTTIRSILLMVNQKELEQIMNEHVFEYLRLFNIDWLNISLDGKSFRGSYDNYTETQRKHFLTGFIHKFNLIISQRDVTKRKTNEIPIAQELIPELVKDMSKYKLMFTMDAMHCQKGTIEIEGADYILQVKENQAGLLQVCQQRGSVKRGYEVGRWDIGKGHGRIEKRRVTVYEGLNSYDEEKFKQVKTVIKVERKRRVIRQGEESIEESWYVSTEHLVHAQAGTLIRNHWGIENKSNHVLDVTFLEDKSRIRVKPEIFGLLRAIALNILRMNGVENITAKRKELSYSEKDLLQMKHL